MISKGEKDHIGDIMKMRDTYLSKQYSKFTTSKLFGGGSSSKAGDTSLFDNTGASLKLNETSLIKDSGETPDSLDNHLESFPDIKRNKAIT